MLNSIFEDNHEINFFIEKLLKRETIRCVLKVILAKMVESVMTVKLVKDVIVRALDLLDHRVLFQQLLHAQTHPVFATVELAQIKMVHQVAFRANAMMVIRVVFVLENFWVNVFK